LRTTRTTQLSNIDMQERKIYFREDCFYVNLLKI
jgi:hypothetical protein